MSENPLIRPRLVRLLKERPRLINLGFREEVLDEIDHKMCQRRSPQHVAEKVSDILINETGDSVRPALRKRAEQRISKMNNSVIDNL